jgi:hypothetical protein
MKIAFIEALGTASGMLRAAYVELHPICEYTFNAAEQKFAAMDLQAAQWETGDMCFMMRRSSK